MRLSLKLKPESQLQLPLSYQHILQGLIYREMEDRDFATFLHEEGYAVEKRAFRLFTFSRLIGRYRINKESKKIIFDDQIEWHVGSIVPRVIRELGRGFVKRDKLSLNGQTVQVEEISYTPPPYILESCKIKMLSPLTIHSTYESKDSKKITQYFDPDDAVFSHLIAENLSNKYYAYYGRSMPGEVFIRPLRVTKRDKVITTFKGFIISGWNGVYELRGTTEALQFAYGVGIGARNSQGFGMFEIV